MTAPHFFAGAPEVGETVVLEPDDARHAIRSLRLGPGDELTSSDGEGALARCRIVRADRLLLEAEVLERSTAERPIPRLTVQIAPPKGDRLSWAIQKLTEIGADDIVLVEAPRSVRRWEGERAERAAARHEAIAREAAKQSRGRFLPRVAGPIPWVEAVATTGGPLVVLWERASRGLLEELPPEAPDRVTLVIGPEGGIPDADAHAAESGGAILASLGPAILRTETAALVGASLVLGRYGRLG